jgi:hypothetical protein
MTFSGAERRRLERFRLSALAELRAMVHDQEEILRLHTRDISSEGVYLSTEHPLPKGMDVSITIFLWIAVLKRLLGKQHQVRVKVDGKVVRSNGDGMAVAFKPGYKITTASESLAH